jgi:hypothetical protein
MLALDAPPESRESLFQSPAFMGELGVQESLVLDLFVKHAFRAGNCTLSSLAETLKLPIELVEQIFRNLKSQQLIEVKGMRGDDFAFVLSPAGKNLAAERMQISRYCGPVPVSLSHYQAVVKKQAVRVKVNRERLAYAYSDLIVPPDLIERLGPALVLQSSMFLYGPSGTGKSSLAERLLRIFNDAVAVPYAIEVDGAIISMFDPAVHRPADAPLGHCDPRWAWCARPCIVVGGELVASMLELQRDAETGAYVAPLHVKANNGIFVIDDFGRQLLAPRDLLNRWIVPLDRRVDFLAMSSGSKFAVPFEVFVVFSTNLNPTELADEAFLRRIPNKILVDAVSPDVFDQIVQRTISSRGWQSDAGAAQYLREVCQKRGGDLRPCYPRDFFRIIESISAFNEKEPRLTVEDVDRAAELYFGKLTV